MPRMIDANSHEPQGRLERTVMELAHIERAAAFRRSHRVKPRGRLHHSDELLRLVEECKVRRMRMVPPTLWRETVAFIAAVDPQLRDDLGLDRRPEHVADVLFMTQGQLMHAAQIDRASLGLAPIIPLFGPRSSTAGQ